MIRCPRCHYPFLGLPEKHACPECGLDYDVDMRYLRFPQRAQRWVRFVCSMIFIFMIAAAIGEDGVTQKNMGPLIVLCGVFALVVVRFLRLKSGSAELIINMTGIELNHSRKGHHRIAWSRVNSARCNWFLGNLVVIGHENQTLLSVNRRELGGRLLVRDCVDYMNKRLQDYLARQVAPLNPPAGPANE